jgi:hypothetical protein
VGTADQMEMRFAVEVLKVVLERDVNVGPPEIVETAFAADALEFSTEQRYRTPALRVTDAVTYEVASVLEEPDVMFVPWIPGETVCTWLAVPADNVFGDALNRTKSWS